MIRRTEHSAEKKFTIINRQLAQDRSLSFQARGLLLYILSKPSNWRAKYDDLRREGSPNPDKPMGRTALDNIVKELVSAGYVRRRRERRESGEFVWIMDVFEEPQAVINQCTSTSTGTSARQPPTGEQAVVIDSTRVRATSNKSINENKEKGAIAPGVAYKDNHPTQREDTDPRLIEPPFTDPHFLALLAKFTQHCKERKKPLTPVWRVEMYAEWRTWGLQETILALQYSITGGYTRVVRPYQNGHGGKVQVSEHPVWMAPPKPM